MPLPLQSTSALVTAGTGILLWIAEGVLPFFRGRVARAAHAAGNLGIAATNLIIILPSGIATSAILQRTGSLYSGLHGTGLGTMNESIIIILLLDLWMYLWHRLNHEAPLFWRFHSVHHSDCQLDVTSAWRFHPGEILFSELFRLPFLVLIGAGTTELLLYNLLMTPVIEFHHSNIRVPELMDRTLRAIIPTPLLHRIHHSPLRREHDTNFGAMLSLWDRLFGTLLVKPLFPTTPIGLEGESAPEMQRFGSLLKKPFRTSRPL